MKQTVLFIVTIVILLTEGGIYKTCVLKVCLCCHSDNMYTGHLEAVDFVDPPNGTLIANFEGTVNATTLSCNITNPEGNQITTQWNVGNFRGSGPIAFRRVTEAPELFFVSGDPIPNTNFLFDNRLTILSWATELDGVIVYCGTGQMPEQAHFILRVYRKSLTNNL